MIHDSKHDIHSINNVHITFFQSIYKNTTRTSDKIYGNESNYESNFKRYLSMQNEQTVRVLVTLLQSFQDILHVKVGLTRLLIRFVSRETLDGDSMRLN